MALHNHSPEERQERLAALSGVLERLNADPDADDERATDAMPEVERGRSRQGRSTSLSSAVSKAGDNPFRKKKRKRLPFEPDKPPFAPDGVTEFLNTQFDRVLR